VLFWIAVVWLVLIIAAGGGSPSVLPLDSPTQVFACIPNCGPRAGTICSVATSSVETCCRASCSVRASSLEVGFTAVFIGLVFAGPAGLVAGYFGGKTRPDHQLGDERAAGVPRLVLALAVIAFLGQSLRNVILILGLLSIAPLARLVRASTVVYAPARVRHARRA